MARETRRQRRAARAAAGDGAAAGRRSRVQPRPAAQPVKQQTGRRTGQRRGEFVRESAAELRKVDWPNRRQTFQGVVVVIIACVIVAAYLYALDQAFRPLVDRIV